LRPDEPRAKKARRGKSKIKALVIIFFFFFDCRGIVLIEWTPKGQLVKGVYYVETLKRLRERVRHKRPDFVDGEQFDHAFRQCRSILGIRCARMAKNCMTTIERPPYSSDLSPCDFSLFDKIENALRGSHLAAVENIKAETTRVLKAIAESEFQMCSVSWKKTYAPVYFCGRRVF